MQVPPKVGRALNPADMFDTTSLQDLDEIMLSTFLGENALKKKSTRRFWNPIFSVAVN